MANREQILAKADTLISQVAESIISAQSNFKASKGRYWQGLETHSAPPVDGTDTTPDKKGSKASNETLDWDQMVNLPNKSPVSIRVDTYESPSGHGCTLTARFTNDGETWRRTINLVGPNSRLTEPWRKEESIPNI